MSRVLYATGNADKFRQAQHTCSEAGGITFIQKRLEVPELQSEDAADIARDKATKAFEIFQEPVVVSDDSWSIPGLNGFPGPYMKYMNDWLGINDWLNLTVPLADRRIVLRQYVAYRDKSAEKIFYCDIEGTLLTESRGKSKYPHTTLVSFDGGKLTNAEYHEQGRSATAHLPNVWHQFAAWYKRSR
jgi:non-canonical purine NTP pyrophosphatase (RdgB/HAM1 family)